jgi:hypothetical protein
MGTTPTIQQARAKANHLLTLSCGYRGTSQNGEMLSFVDYSLDSYWYDTITLAYQVIECKYSLSLSLSRPLLKAYGVTDSANNQIFIFITGHVDQ